MQQTANSNLQRQSEQQRGIKKQKSTDKMDYVQSIVCAKLSFVQSCTPEHRYYIHQYT